MYNIFIDLWNNKKRDIQNVPLFMSTNWNKNFQSGFIQFFDFCSENACKLVHILLDNAAFTYLNNISESMQYK